MAPKDAQGFTPRYDTRDVFILQIEGSKQWRIYDSSIQLPLKSQQYHPAVERLGSPLYQFDVTAVDVIYVPRGYIHEAATADSTSVHITVGVVSNTWERVFGEALKSICDEEVRFRKSLPVGFVEQDELIDPLKEQFSELLRVFRETEF